jgi:uncharacterized protein DUF1905
MMKFRSHVEPAEPMRGLEVPPEVVEALGEGRRPAVTITINGHSWKSGVAIMRGRYLLGLGNANRKAAGVAAGDEAGVLGLDRPEVPLARAEDHRHDVHRHLVHQAEGKCLPADIARRHDDGAFPCELPGLRDRLCHIADE